MTSAQLVLACRVCGASVELSEQPGARSEALARFYRHHRRHRSTDFTVEIRPRETEHYREPVAAG